LNLTFLPGVFEYNVTVVTNEKRQGKYIAHAICGGRKER